MMTLQSGPDQEGDRVAALNDNALACYWMESPSVVNLKASSLSPASLSETDSCSISMVPLTSYASL
jgi:hypothetical protein